MPQRDDTDPRSTLGAIEASIKLEVPFYDVDSYQIAWHGNYPKYFEQARGKCLEMIGHSYAEMEESGYLYPVVAMNLKYIHPLLYRQQIRVTATLVEWQHKLTFNYLIVDVLDGRRLTRGSTSQVAIAMPQRITQIQSPEPLRRAVREHLERVDEKHARANAD